MTEPGGYRFENGHPPQLRQCIAKIVRACPLTSKYSEASVVTCAGMARSRTRRRAPTPFVSHHPLPRVSRSASSPARTMMTPGPGPRVIRTAAFTTHLAGFRRIASARSPSQAQAIVCFRTEQIKYPALRNVCVDSVSHILTRGSLVLQPRTYFQFHSFASSFPQRDHRSETGDGCSTSIAFHGSVHGRTRAPTIHRRAG